jgi:translation initiation factor 3 subunit M
MASNTLLIEGSFEELSEELAVYIDGLSQSSCQAEIAPLLKDGNKVDALKKIVTASSALNSAPERGESFFPSLLTNFPSVF